MATAGAPGRRLSRWIGIGVVTMLAAAVAGCGDDTAAERADTTWAEPTCTSHDVERPLPPAPGPDLPSDETERLQTIADSFCARWTVRYPEGTFSVLVPPLPEDDARCIAQGLVDLLGVERLQALGFGTGPWSLLSFGLSHGRAVDGAETASMVDVFAGCSPSFEQLLILSVTDGADEISAGSAACVADKLNDRTTRTILAGEMDRAYDTDPDATPFPELIDPLVKAYDRCLTPAERSKVDFN